MADPTHDTDQPFWIPVHDEDDGYVEGVLWVDEDGEPLVVDEPPKRELRLPPRWAWALVALVVVVGGLGWYADHRSRVGEQQALTRCHDRLQAASGFADVRLGAMSDYIRPAISMIEDRHQIDDLAALMERPARSALPDVLAASRRCHAVEVHGWHQSLAARRDADIAYADALSTRLRQVRADGLTYYDDDQGLGRLRLAADIGYYRGRPSIGAVLGE